MPTNAEFGRRARDARRWWALRHDSEELTFEEIGRRVATVMGREPAFSHQAVRRWFSEGQEPDSFATAAALAVVLEVEPAWLAFGEIGAPPPADLRPGVYSTPFNPVEGPSPYAVARAAEESAARKAKRRRGG